MELSFSEDARSHLEALDKAIWSVPHREPCAFPLSDAGHHTLLQQPQAVGCREADAQPKQSIKCRNCHSQLQRGSLQVRACKHGNKNTEGFMLQQCNPGKLFSEEKPDPGV